MELGLRVRECDECLFRLEFDRGGEVDRFGDGRDRDFVAGLRVARDYVWFRPVQVPAVFDRYCRVDAGDYVRKGEAAIEIALIAAEEFEVCVGVGGD